MTFELLLQTSLMKDAQIIAGAAGLSAEVIWCVPDTELQFNNWIMPGLLILYTGNYASSSWFEYIQTMSKANPSGILLFEHETALVIPQETLDYINVLGIPVIRMPHGIQLFPFVKRFVSFIADCYDDDYRREHFLKEVCYSEAYPGSETTAEEYGYKYTLNYFCLIATLKETTSTRYMAEIEIETARSVICQMLSCKDGKVLSFIDNRSLISFIPHPRNSSPRSLHTKILSAADKILRDSSRSIWSFNVGSMAQSFSDFPRSYDNAHQTSEITTILNAHTSVNFYEDWYMQLTLLKKPKEELRTYMEYIVGPILPIPELIETLNAYLSLGENLRLTAENLFIHVNTLKYRLHRISELLDCDLKDPNTYLRLRIATTIERYLSR